MPIEITISVEDRNLISANKNNPKISTILDEIIQKSKKTRGNNE